MTDQTQARRARKERQRLRLLQEVATLRDALSLLQRISAEGNKNDPATSLRNVHAVATTALGTFNKPEPK